MHKIIVCFFLFVGLVAQRQFPTWFHTVPNGCLVVVVADNMSREGRALALVNEANRLLALEKQSIKTTADVGFAIETSSVQKDRFNIDFEFTEPITQNYFLESKLRLLDYERYEGQFILALFGKNGQKVNTSREAISQPEWTSENVADSTAALGFGEGNMMIYSDRIKAFKHALFNLTMSHSAKSFTSTNIKKTTTEQAQNSTYSKLNVNLGASTFHGLKISHQWISPEGVWYLRLQKVKP
jgi:hypothetical protein